eukprot:CAMPEP_0198329692 /NCGR_PEP_ID=MMETSP1450-20131203/16381_1 /TAXON_ID=753684 ORGANISM="Madagascaria erythrocladiodes, Strain CCMP3234" /NCGR_SAMPLE_ID=MMETSP1450 /ASSEMBLY_ACC=CAM_ASM_001115 /LENGTH=49 /DNA_ID=CAMNT_0044033935 /DNA_START=36 /DNA_END=185 /DNA_ORIENTATION=+
MKSTQLSNLVNGPFVKPHAVLRNNFRSQNQPRAMAYGGGGSLTREIPPA